MNLKEKLQYWLWNDKVENLENELRELKLRNHLEEMGRATMLIVDPEKVIRTDEIIVDEMGRPVKRKVLTIGNRQLSPEETRILKEECAYVKRTMWWDLCQNTIGETARQVMFEKSQSFDDMKTGKAMLYDLDILKKVIERILEK